MPFDISSFEGSPQLFTFRSQYGYTLKFKLSLHARIPSLKISLYSKHIVQQHMIACVTVSQTNPIKNVVKCKWIV